jgi:anti-anti-sigma regulatory factor
MMNADTTPNVVCETLAPQVCAVRFVRPDLRAEMYDNEAIEDCVLYRDLHAAALGNLATGSTMILNLGLIDMFPTAFYRLLLKVRETVKARQVQLLLCCLPPNVQECFDLFGGGKLFQISKTEASAAREAKK